MLASAGVKVKILERLPILGGRTLSIEAEGYKLDLGTTFFLYPRVLDEVLQAAGTSLKREVELIKLDQQYRIQFGAGGKLDYTPNVAEIERQIASVAPRERLGRCRHCSSGVRCCRSLFCQRSHGYLPLA